MKINEIDEFSYKYLGNFNAAEAYAGIPLQCDLCKVIWIGCWDNSMCPQCGDGTCWEEVMKMRGCYK